jgi:hypothetical protein
MVHLLSFSPSDGSLVHRPESARSDSPMSAANSPQPTQAMSQMVLKWHESALPEMAPLQLAPAQLAAMHHLVKRIAQLRSTNEVALDSPEALLPYVSPEAQEVLMQWEQSLLEQSQLDQATPLRELHQASFWSRTIQPLATLIPYLLWSIAKSTHETVRLIEGVWAEVDQDQARQTGVLRLVVLLELNSDQDTNSFDLVTGQPAPGLLKDGQILIRDSLVAQQPTADTVLLQQLSAQITATEPALEQFWQGFAAEWLLPNQDWQAGTLRLRLGLEFTALAANSASASPTEPSLIEPFAVTDPLSPTLRFTHPAWLEQHITSAVEHQLTQFLHNCRPLPSSPNSLVAVVQQGCAAIDGLQRSLTLASRTFAQQPLSLNELELRLLWGINRTAYEVMQFTSGLHVSLWQPNQTWTTGLLRFVLELTIRTPEQTQSFDLVRRAARCVTSPPAATAIVRSDESEWCHHPVLLSHLEAMLRQPIEQNAPELVLLQSDTEVAIKDGDIWQNGVIRLNTAFEFIPDGEWAGV